MNRRLIAAAVLGIMIILGGIDLLEDTGLIHYSTTEMDRSLEDVLDDYGEAIRSAEIALSGPVTLNLLPSGFYYLSSRDLASSGVAYALRRKRNIDFSRSAFNPLKYIQVSLI